MSPLVVTTHQSDNSNFLANNTYNYLRVMIRDKSVRLTFVTSLHFTLYYVVCGPVYILRWMEAGIRTHLLTNTISDP